MDTETLIIGGGLSGLSLARHLSARGDRFLLVEARDRWGGRIFSETHAGGAFDLGPSWFWPGQPRIAALVDALGLTRFDQYADGALSYEEVDGSVQRGRGFASMEGSWRIDGGFGAMTSAIAAALPQNNICLSTKITALEKTENGITARTETGDDIHARRVVLALPPRLAAQFAFTPALPSDTMTEMAQVATWMAGHAKAFAIYDRPFWRDAGLSGDAMSRKGPLAEIHDASAADGPYALFGFVGLPPAARLDQAALKQAILDQLVRIFGAEAAAPQTLSIKDWTRDPLTATSLDHQPLSYHPHYGMPRALLGLWDGRLVFAGTEVANEFGGYLEGALVAAEAALTQIPATEGAE